MHRFLTIAGLIWIAGCTPRPPPLNELRVQIGSEPVTLDPSRWEDGQALKILANTVSTLFETADRGELVPRLAESYRWSRDGLQLNLTLKKQAAWSNGDPITARDIARGLERALNPKTSGKLAEFLFPIQGARAYHAGKTRSLGSIRVKNDSTLSIRLESKAPYFLKALSLPFTPLHEKASEGVVSGPYRLKEAKTGEFILLERNSKSWEPDRAASFERVRFVLIQNESTALNAFKKGQLDVLTRIPSYDYPALKDRAQTFPFAATYYIGFNARKPPFNDKRNRRRVRDAIFSNEIVKILGTDETPADYWLPPRFEGYLPSRPFRALPKKEAFPKPSAPLVLGFDGNQRNQTICERIQQQAAERLGLKIELSPMDWKSYIKSLESDPPALFRMGWQAPYMDAFPHLRIFTTDNPNNYTGWSNPEYDRLVQEIGGLENGLTRTEKIQKAQELLIDDEAVVIPIYHYSQSYLTGETVKGFSVNPIGIAYYDRVSREPSR